MIKNIGLLLLLIFGVILIGISVILIYHAIDMMPLWFSMLLSSCIIFYGGSHVMIFVFKKTFNV